MVVKSERADLNVQRVLLEETEPSTGIKSSPKMQQTEETLSQFWHALNGLAAPCDFGEITTTLVLDMFFTYDEQKGSREIMY